MPYAACKACTDLSDLQRVAALVLALALAACSSMPRPTEQIDAARAAVSKAEPVVVSQEGAMELRVAQYKLALSQQEAERGDHANARIYAEQAQVDADYARAIADNARVQRAAADANQSVRRLQEELDRRTK
jgi:lipopolysaccharide biosynthesis regulator YciM